MLAGDRPGSLRRLYQIHEAYIPKHYADIAHVTVMCLP